ncbi:TPA: folylpolyglutamate synthase/dihydrofolate synthase family protein [Streptococcus suis]
METWLNEKQGVTYRYKMEKVQFALELLGNPEKKIRVVHVAGTNGKGSTVAFLSHLLQGQGFRVGTFTSPHMETVRDRISINGQPMIDTDFQSLLGKVAYLEKRVARRYEAFSYFETLFLVMLAYFSHQNIDYVLVETGIGGREDVTVLVDPLLTIITSIGLDHQDLLGYSLKEIAEQKAGIVKDGVPLLVGPLAPEVLAICSQSCQIHQAPLYQCGKDFRLEEMMFTTDHHGEIGPIKLGLKGSHQEENAAVALQAFCLLAEKDGWSINEHQVLISLEKTSWAGRMEQISAFPNIYLDGAHNLPAIERLMEFVQQESKGCVTILFSALKRKNFKEMLAALKVRLPDANIILTSFDYVESIGEEDADGAGIYRSDYRAFVREWKENATREDCLFITGSLYFISEIRKFLSM